MTPLLYLLVVSIIVGQWALKFGERRPQLRKYTFLRVENKIHEVSDSGIECWNDIGYRKPLHWVVKSGSLERTLEFYKENFNMEVFRHEEFDSGCEATCNGPYGGAWSKTMIGLGTREDNTFALEITFNYGIYTYDRGNDLRYLTLSANNYIGPEALIQTDEMSGRRYLQAPDHWILLEESPVERDQLPVLYVSLHVTDLEHSLKFYSNILGASPVHHFSHSNADEKSAVVSWELNDQVSISSEACADAGRKNTRGACIELVQLPPGQKVERAQAFGRFAIETEDNAPFYLAERLVRSRKELELTAATAESRDSDDRMASAVKWGSVAHGPLKLQPHGEEVLIVQDPDGHEFCFVDARGFRNCTDVANQEVKRNFMIGNVHPLHVVYFCVIHCCISILHTFSLFTVKTTDGNSRIQRTILSASREEISSTGTIEQRWIEMLLDSSPVQWTQTLDRTLRK